MDQGDREMDYQQNNDQNATGNRTNLPAKASQCIEWYTEGDGTDC